jgi:hypothetical protein
VSRRCHIVSQPNGSSSRCDVAIEQDMRNRGIRVRYVNG